MEGFPITPPIEFGPVPIVEKNEKVLRSQAIRLKPNRKQRQILYKWFDLYRWMYNEAIAYIKCGAPKSFYKLRKVLFDELTSKQLSMIKKSKVPRHTLDNAIHDVIKAYKSGFANLAARNVTHFRVRKKRSYCPQETIVLESTAFSKKHNTFAPRALGNRINSSQPIRGIKNDCRLTWNKRTGHLTLYKPEEVQLKGVQNRKKVCSLDPGVRTFQTMYSPNGCKEYGKGIGAEIKSLLSRLKSDRCQEPWWGKYSRRIYDKIKHKIQDLHWKTALELVKNYDTILLGNLSTKRVIGKLAKPIRAPAQFVSHFLFRQRLLSKAEEYGAEVVLVNEAWTSKTCGGCFRRHHELGASKVFDCPSCPFKWDRDLNGARNIMLKHFNLLE